MLLITAHVRKPHPLGGREEKVEETQKDNELTAMLDERIISLPTMVGI